MGIHKQLLASINSCSLLLVKDTIFGKQKFGIKQLKMNKFISDVKQLTMHKFIKSSWQLIISTLHATPEVHPLLCPYSYIIYLVTNNLYGRSMMQLLLDWVNPKDFNLDNHSINTPIGCFLEVDLDYPDELHNLHNDYPLVGEKIEAKKNVVWLSITNHRR